MPRRIPETLRITGRGLEAVITTSAASLAAAAHLQLIPAERRRLVLDRYVRAWAARMLHAGGAEVVLVGPAPPEPRGPRVVVANHRSMLDTPVLLRLFGGHFLAHSGLASLPLLGPAARLGGVVFVDRDEPGSRLLAMRAMKRLLAQGRSLIVFPEGTTFLGDEVRPFFTGAFHLSPEVEVLPVGLAYDAPAAEFGDESLGAHAARIAARPRTRVAVAFGAPLTAVPPGSERARALAERARGDVQRLVGHARATLSAPGRAEHD